MKPDGIRNAKFINTLIESDTYTDCHNYTPLPATVATNEDSFHTSTTPKKKQTKSFTDCVINSMADTVTGGHPENVDLIMQCNYNEAIIGPQAIFGFFKGVWDYLF